ncbi:MAG: hypothetical protein DRG78_01485 [Epsilonproteobacteria bacterium]|nr:MAG: hypothetical protein DRG78_01485 [Campylobacterota bacterium]
MSIFPEYLTILSDYPHITICIASLILFLMVINKVMGLVNDIIVKHTSITKARRELYKEQYRIEKTIEDIKKNLKFVIL